MFASGRKREEGIRIELDGVFEQVHGRRGRSLVSIYWSNAHSGTKTTAQLSSDSATTQNAAHRGDNWVSLSSFARDASLSRQPLSATTTLTSNEPGHILRATH
jgi:hypothetical protein